MRKFSDEIRRQVGRAIRELENWPDVRNGKALQGSNAVAKKNLDE
jgi:hypothetical protein